MEFIKSEHLYLNDYGIIIPSVTQLISWKLGSGYDDVPKAILQRKAEYGTSIHALIEKYHETGSYKATNPYQVASLEAYKSLASKLPNVSACEELVMFDNRLAGCIDLIYEDGSLGDIKTYATLDEHALLKLRWQLSLYTMCKYGDDKEAFLKKGHLVWLPKSMAFKTQEIELFSYEDCIALLEEYEKAQVEPK